MAMIEQVPARQRRVAQAISYLVVIAAGLAVGALIGAIGALLLGLVTINC